MGEEGEIGNRDGQLRRVEENALDLGDANYTPSVPSSFSLAC